MAHQQFLDFEQIYQGKNVLVTGHTGFTGSWLASWLRMLGANVFGFALSPNTQPSIYDELALETETPGVIGDLRDYQALQIAIDNAQPEIIFHLAAQPLVSRSFDDPLEAFSVNAMGTANVLEIARTNTCTKAVVCITTDKVYKDQNWHWGYRETDQLGGKDPYSASKAAAELIAGSYQQSMAERGNGVLISIARGGNIIGGGDWSENRIVPDFVRAHQSDDELVLRNPSSTRPWQHVLALVNGYLLLGSGLLQGDKSKVSAWNFGPSTAGNKTVRELIATLSKHWPLDRITFGEGWFPETSFLHVDSTLSRAELGWNPPLDFEETCNLTASWYRRFYAGENASSLVDEQIELYRHKLGLET